MENSNFLILDFFHNKGRQVEKIDFKKKKLFLKIIHIAIYLILFTF